MPVYLDNHATTAVDPRVVEVMRPLWSEHYGNAGSRTHAFGQQAAERVANARGSLAEQLGVRDDELIFTSGATESNNLALRGWLEHPARRDVPCRLISVRTEHRAILDPLQRVIRLGVPVTWLDVFPQGHPLCGQIDLGALERVLSGAHLLEETSTNAPGDTSPTQLTDAGPLLANASRRPATSPTWVSVMLANNEIGVIQPIAEIAELCHRYGAVLHCDATQAIGKIPVDLAELNADLVSFSAHKLHGPPGIGALVVRRRSPRLRLAPLFEGGGQEQGLRSGTLPVPLIAGFAHAVALAVEELPGWIPRVTDLRNRLWQGLQTHVGPCHLNGPVWDGAIQPGGEWRSDAPRLPHNLNVRFPGITGEALMLLSPGLALSSGSACSAASPEPSHVLRALGLSDDEIHSSLRFGLSRFTTEDEIDQAIRDLASAARQGRGWASSPPPT